MRRKLAYALAGTIFVVDQLSKLFVTRNLGIDAHGDQLVLLPIFNLTYVENRGISLGMLQADDDLGRWLLVLGTAAIAAAVAWWMNRDEEKADRPALALVLGGALGNIVDRVKDGYVTDFLDLHFGTFRPFYVFNVGDAAISIGVVILLLRAFLIREKAPEGMNEHA